MRGGDSEENLKFAMLCITKAKAAARQLMRTITIRNGCELENQAFLC